MSVSFVCPDCGGQELEEVVFGATVSSIITDIDSDGSLDYGEQTNEDGEVDHYQCTGCSFTPKQDGFAIADADDLVEWIEENCEEKKKKKKK